MSPDTQGADAATDVAVAARALSRLGLVTAFGHVSVRTEAGMLITPAADLGDAVATALVPVALGAATLPAGAPAECWVHLCLYRARPDVGAIARAQPAAANAVSVLVTMLRPRHGQAAWLGHAVPVHDNARLLRSSALAEAAAAALPEGEALLLRGNGAITVGASPGIAVTRMWLLAQACELFLSTRDGRERSDDEIDSWRSVGEEMLPRLWRHLAAERTSARLNAGVDVTLEFRKGGDAMAENGAAAATPPVSRGRVRVEQCHKRVRVYLDAELVADTIRPLLVWEAPYYPTYYIPAADVRARLVANGATERSPSRGTAEMLDVVTATGTAAGAARRYPDSPLAELREAVRLDWAAMTEWLEEDEPVYTHPRDPYTRVDILASSRHVRVELDGVTLADSHAPRILFETSLPPRYYLPISDLRRELLRASDSQSHCPYKGAASYWSVEVNGKTYDDLVWIYRTPLPESQKIAGLACFYNERVDLFVDGVLQERPATKFS